MLYCSTRGATTPRTFKQAILEGLARDGGLLVPENLPQIGPLLTDWQQLDYPDLAIEVLSLFAPDLPRALIASCCHRAYGPRYGTEVAPLIPWSDDRYVLELIHGPTLAFKDVALQLLGQLFDAILADEGRHLNIVAATSGDTGSAAIAAVRGSRQVKIFVTHPRGKISHLQRLQMSTILDTNVYNLAVDGSFDDCQAMVKEVGADLDFKDRYAIGAVNSINWARIAAQIVYYIAAYLKTPLAHRKVPAVFAIPTGNFGNILAAEYARQMGLPISSLILASNENDILPTFFRTGVYRRGEARSTYSPAMDIQVSSNFERYLFMMLKGDANSVQELMDNFTSTGTLSIDDMIRTPWLAQYPLYAKACSDDATVKTICKVFQTHQRLLDPHSATAWWALDQHLPQLDPDHSKIVVATAHPAKFPTVLGAALPEAQSHFHHPSLDKLQNLPERLFHLPVSTQALKAFITDHLPGGSKQEYLQTKENPSP